MIEHVPTIVDMRRYLVMEKARIPGTAQETLQNIEQRGHPVAGHAAHARDVDGAASR